MSVEKTNETLVNEITSAAKENIPRSVRKRFTPGWSDELKRAVHKRQEARKDFIRNSSATNRKRYNAYSRRAKRIRETTRATEWQKLCDGLNFRTSSRTAWRLVRRVEGKRTASGTEPLVVNDRTLLTARAEAEAFTRFYTRVEASNSQASKQMVDKVRKDWERRPSVANRTFYTYFTIAELKAHSGSRRRARPRVGTASRKRCCPTWARRPKTPF